MSAPHFRSGPSAAKSCAIRLGGCEDQETIRGIVSPSCGQACSLSVVRLKRRVGPRDQQVLSPKPRRAMPPDLMALIDEIVGRMRGLP